MSLTRRATPEVSNQQSSFSFVDGLSRIVMIADGYSVPLLGVVGRSLGTVDREFRSCMATSLGFQGFKGVWMGGRHTLFL